MDLDQLVRQLKALGERNRLALAVNLAGGERGAGELLQASGLSQPNLSRHLKVLREAGVIAERREGRSAFYRLAENGLAQAILPLVGISFPVREAGSALAEGARRVENMSTYASKKHNTSDPLQSPPLEAEEEPQPAPMEDWML